MELSHLCGKGLKARFFVCGYLAFSLQLFCYISQACKENRAFQ